MLTQNSALTDKQGEERRILDLECTVQNVSPTDKGGELKQVHNSVQLFTPQT